jgi:hypothetical protein
MTFTKAILALACLMPGTLVAQAAKVTPVPVLTENSIALQEREQHASGNEFLGLRKHLSNRRVVNDAPYRLPEQRITAAGSMYILKRKRWLKLPVVRIGGEVHPPAAVQ